MTTYEQDPDVIEWGLQFFAGDMFYNIGYCDNISRVDIPGDHRLCYGTDDYDRDCSDLENNQLIAHALQQELSQLAVKEDNLEVSLFPKTGLVNYSTAMVLGYAQEEEDDIGLSSSCSSPDENLYVGIDSLRSSELIDEYALYGELYELVELKVQGDGNGQVR